MPTYMSRDPTIYSLNQLEQDLLPCKCDAVKQSQLAVSDIRGSCVPTLQFANRKEYERKRVRSFGDFGGVVPDMDAVVPDMDNERAFFSSDDDSLASEALDMYKDFEVPEKSLLSTALLAEWEERFERGLFRYDVTACETKFVPGIYGFIAQFNEGRGSKKRPTEFTIDKVCQSFEDAKFNFKKAAQQEILFQFVPSRTEQSDYCNTLVLESPNFVFINVSPIEYGHVLLVPRVLDNINQVVEPSTVLLALQFAHEADDPYFRVGFNSLGAYGTINHLHFQAYFLAAPFPVERAPTVPFKDLASRKDDVRISRLCNYPVSAIVFEAGASLSALASAVGIACQNLTEANVPHNLLISDCGARVFLFPNAFSERKARGDISEDVLATMVDPACWEISGHMVLKRHEDYGKIDQDLAWKLLSYASFPEEQFQQVAHIAIGGFY